VKRALIMAVAAPMILGAGPPQTGSVLVEVLGLRSAKGLVQACLTATAAKFPDCNKDPAALRLTVPARSGATLFFANVPPGRYAIALFHDENSNDRLDTTLMIPREGYGFSRDAPVRFGPPRFAAAAMVVAEAELRTVIHLRYIL
jgi:uncharacterized protein (DUF2141 family)